MSWRAGSKLFAKIWPLVQSNIPDKEDRIEFTGRLLMLLVENDMDPHDIEDIHPDVRAAMRAVGIPIGEPDLYTDDAAEIETKKKKWWQLR